jgi:exopolyphosphatase/guanosine-5'-triphosphate,3'-diphosphate pyrophosphatase
MMQRVAIIDTGTNSTRLLLAEVDSGQIVEIERRTVITRLGEGVDSSGRLRDVARKRVAECVATFAAVIDTVPVDDVVIIATSSVRDSVDGAGFIAELAERYSFRYRILGGEEESRLSFNGAMSDVDIAGRAVLIDIGGGSTEIAAGRPDSVEYTVSLSVGCVRVTERFLKQDPPSSSQLADARSYLEKEIIGAVEPILDRDKGRTFAVAGTMTTLAAIDLGLKSYDREAVHGHVLTLPGIKALLETLVGMSLDRRKEITVMESGRADVIVAGALIAVVVLEAMGSREVTISEKDILDGAALAILSGTL